MLIFEVLVLVVLPLIYFKLFRFILRTDCTSKVCLVGKTALVTGGSSGIGYQIVLALLQRGCKVIIADKIKDENLFKNIFKETRSRNVVFEYVDLASFESIRNFVRTIKKNEEKLDILIHNAGIGRTVSGTTEDCLDIVMQINYFSAFLLTHLLVDLLKKTRGRIIFTSSGLSYLHDFSIEKLKPEGVTSIDYTYHYHNSKLCLIIIGEIFAEKLKKYGVTSNVYHPGLARTNIFHKSFQPNGTFSYGWFYIKCLEYISWFLGNNAEISAQTAIHLACANEVEDITGEYFYETKPIIKPKFVRKKKNFQLIWDTTEELVKLAPEERL